MNKLLLVLIISSINYSSDAQVNKLKIKKEAPKKEKQSIFKGPTTSLTSIDVYYGSAIYKNNFYHQLNTKDSFNINTPPNIIGIGISGMERNIGASYLIFQIELQSYIPHTISINDSIKAKLGGFNLGLGFGKRFASKNSNLSIACYFGFNTGRSTLKNSENISSQKIFFCPKFSIQPKLFIKRLAISIIISAQNDITSSKWIHSFSNNKNEIPLSGFSQTAIIGLISLGYRIY